MNQVFHLQHSYFKNLQEISETSLSADSISQQLLFKLTKWMETAGSNSLAPLLELPFMTQREEEAENWNLSINLIQSQEGENMPQSSK